MDPTGQQRDDTMERQGRYVELNTKKNDVIKVFYINIYIVDADQLRR